MLVSMILCYIIIFIINFFLAQCNLVHVQTFEGEVGAENFTYYKLVLEGHVLVRLQTLEGDADLYLSSETLRPTWDDYTIKSDTCSHEVVVVRKYLSRPIGIGVYGYVHYPISRYQLSVYIDKSQDNYYPDVDPKENEDVEHLASKDASLNFEEEPEESMFWNFMISFLKFLLEVLL